MTPCRARERDRRGMTLAELSAVIIIVGILAAIAIPNMQKTVQQGHWQHAQDILRLIHNGQQRYFDKEGVYVDVPSGALMDDWRQLYMDDPQLPNIPVTYVVVAPATLPAVFTATATNTPTGEQMTIDQDGVLCVDVSIPPNNCGSWPKP